MDGVIDLTGRKYTGGMRVTLRPGFGIRHDGQHVEGGPHVLPIALALDLIHTNRADPIVEEPVPEVKDEAKPKAEPPVVAHVVTHADPQVENRDPVVAQASAPKRTRK